MRLIALELKNIRSYREASIEFPSGITLLSGDIGVGKSTLLLAIEFALFGISRGELVGNALLRHGASDGRVTLRFGIQDREYLVCRTLKRGASGVTQDTGYIDAGNGRELLTPSELRARIYELLGYPLQFLAKQRNLLYRFTIYTPQEEMKSILAQASDERLETVRRIFGIDAYRIARDNAQLVARALREREMAHEALLPHLKGDEERLLAQLGREPEIAQAKLLLSSEREGLLSRLREAEAALAGLEKERIEIQHEQQIALMQERSRGIIEQELRMMQQQLERKERQVRDTANLVGQLKSAHALFTKEADVAAAAELQARQRETLSEIEKLKQEEGKILVIMEQSRSGPAIAPGTACPTCKQQVSSQHLDELKASLAAQLQAAGRKQEKVAARIAEQRSALQALQAAVERKRQADDVALQLSMQEKALHQHEEDKRSILAAIEAKRKALPPPMAPDGKRAERAKAIDRQALERKAEVQRHREALTGLEKRMGRIEQEEKGIGDARERLVIIGAQRLEHENALARDAQVRGWIQRQLTPFSSTVERHVLMSIHMTFDAVFRQWFGRLIEDDALSTRIDHEFAPVMLQHGYETDVAFLSGGERTAVSLAYRLALVHTIHVMLPHLGTAGLIMLDEPTDGFSAEQLERVRDVLRELRMEQIILVSHEQQLEGFVDHILRVRKSGDGSAIEVAA